MADGGNPEVTQPVPDGLDPGAVRLAEHRRHRNWAIGLGIPLGVVAIVSPFVIYSGPNNGHGGDAPEPIPTVRTTPSVGPTETADSEEDEYIPWVEPDESESTTPTPESTSEVSAATSSNPEDSATPRPTPKPKPSPTKTNVKPPQYGAGITVIDFSQATDKFSSTQEGRQVARGVIEALGEAGVRVTYTAEELRALSGKAGLVVSFSPSNEDEPSIRYRNEGGKQTAEKACIEQKAAELALKELQPTDADQIYVEGVPAYRVAGTLLGELPKHTIWNGFSLENLPGDAEETAIANAIKAIRNSTDSFVLAC